MKNRLLILVLLIGSAMLPNNVSIPMGDEAVLYRSTPGAAPEAAHVLKLADSLKGNQKAMVSAE